MICARIYYIRFLNFFESRLRRIWPAYFFLIFVCIILFNYAFLGDTLHNFMKDSFFASIFHSNHWFSKKLTEYAAETSLNLPLLHTWSLSVEIKFYLFFPIIIFLCFSITLYTTLTINGVMNFNNITGSILATIPVMFGVIIGNKLRSKVNQKKFKVFLIFFLIIIGINLIRKGLF